MYINNCERVVVVDTAHEPTPMFDRRMTFDRSSFEHDYSYET
jgi:hypothetical protein